MAQGSEVISGLCADFFCVNVPLFTDLCQHINKL